MSVTIKWHSRYKKSCPKKTLRYLISARVSIDQDLAARKKKSRLEFGSGRKIDDHVEHRETARAFGLIDLSRFFWIMLCAQISTK